MLKLHNMEILEKGILITINPSIFSIQTVFSAAYVFMDRAFITIDGDPETKLEVFLIPKEKEDTLLEKEDTSKKENIASKKENLETLGRDFNNELINYAVYNYQTESNRALRDAIVQKALYSDVTETDFEKIEETDMDGSQENYEEDPLGISKPWSDENEGSNC